MGGKRRKGCRQQQLQQLQQQDIHSTRGRSQCVHSPRGRSQCVHSPRGGRPNVHSPRGRSRCVHSPKVGRSNVYSPRLHQQRESTCWFHLHRHGRTACPGELLYYGDASSPSPKDECLAPPKDACLAPLRDACIAPPRDACLAPPKDVCLAPPRDATSGSPGTACCFTSPGAACCSASPVEPSVTGYEGEVELPLPPPWPGALLPSLPLEGPLLLPSPVEGPLLLPSPPEGPLLLSPPEGPLLLPSPREGPASPEVATSHAMQQEILWLEPHGGELLATKRGVRRPPPWAARQLPRFLLPEKLACVLSAWPLQLLGWEEDLPPWLPPLANCCPCSGTVKQEFGSEGGGGRWARCVLHEEGDM
ncbi:UNVERIFIED_CONTAM: hypothetical protein FKN15_075861 [Acipenser sinensis]